MKRTSPTSSFPHDAYTGVIEGFYGRPWTSAQRRDLCDTLLSRGLNSYLYAPKDDLLHRAAWRVAYQGNAALELRGLIARCRTRGLRFIYGLAPGLKSDDTPSEIERSVLAKLKHLYGLGCRHFALMFDDIPAEGFRQHLRHYGSWAGAHIAWTHHALAYFNKADPGVRFLFCPTPYSGSFAGDVESNAYLNEVGDKLAPEVDVFWTGRDIVSQTIECREIQQLSKVIGRPPVIWDNLFANDYDLRRLYLGPYSGRDMALSRCTRGILINPNCEYPANFVPIHTFAEFIRSPRSRGEAAYERAIRAWRGRFRSRQGNLPSLDALRRLIDALSLPFTHGSSADQAISDLDQALAAKEGKSRALQRFRRHARIMMEWQTRIAELEDRDLAYALYRHVWEIKEEFDLLMKYFDFRERNLSDTRSFRSMFHQPGTYRGGYAALLQRRLTPRPDGDFELGRSRR
jgi:beta-N-acetylglucosaminidase